MPGLTRERYVCTSCGPGQEDFVQNMNMYGIQSIDAYGDSLGDVDYVDTDYGEVECAECRRRARYMSPDEIEERWPSDPPEEDECSEDEVDDAPAPKQAKHAGGWGY